MRKVFHLLSMLITFAIVIGGCAQMRDESLKDYCVSASEDGKWGVIDLQGNWIVPNKYSQVLSWSEGLIPVELNARWGFCNTSGKEVIVPQFGQAGEFHGGLAPVTMDSLWGLIDTAGKFIVVPIYKFIGNYGDGYWQFSTVIGTFGVIDSVGNVHQFQYDFVSRFSEGYAQLDNYWNFDSSSSVIMNKKLEIVPLQQEYAYIADFHNGVAGAQTKDGILQIIEPSGKVIFEREAGSLSWMVDYPRYSGLFIMDDKTFTYRGFVNPKGQTVVSGDFYLMQTDSLGNVFVMNNGLWGMYDATGKEVFPVTHHYPIWSNGEVCGLDTNGRYGFKLNSGRWMFDKTFDTICEFNKGYFCYGDKKHWGLLDITRKEIFPMEYEALLPIQHERFILFKQDGRFGVADKSGDILMDARFDMISYEIVKRPH